MDISSIITDLASPVDIVFGIITFVVGHFSARKFITKNQSKGIGIFLQVAVLMIKMARHYQKSHPEAKVKYSDKLAVNVDKLHNDIHSSKLEAVG